MQSYFELLGLTPQFNLDAAQLESSYFKAQRQYHPDRFIGKPDAERLAAMQKSVDINNAYRILKEPLSRAQYVLSLQGISVGTDHDTVKPSQAILIEAMELREEPPAPAALAKTIEQSIAKISGHYTNSDLTGMALETLRLGYLLKAQR